MQDCCRLVNVWEALHTLLTVTPPVVLNSSFFQPVMVAFANFFLDALLPSNSKWANILNEIRKHLIFYLCPSENQMVSWGLHIITFCFYLHFTGKKHHCRQKQLVSIQLPASLLHKHASEMSLINLCERRHSFCIPESTLSFALSFCLSWMFDVAASCSVDVTAAQMQ